MFVSAVLAFGSALSSSAQVCVVAPVVSIAVLASVPIAPLGAGAFAPSLPAVPALQQSLSVVPLPSLPSAAIPTAFASSPLAPVRSFGAPSPAVVEKGAALRSPTNLATTPSAVSGGAIFDGAAERAGDASPVPAIEATPARGAQRGPLSPVEKTRRFNAAGTASGVFAEIGAGQRVADYVFAGEHASRTVLKSISAYAKKASDARYGQAARFVSEERLRQMLDKESAEAREVSTPGVPLFAFADTVATNKGKGQGWMGLRFQSEVGGSWNTIIIHAKITDAGNLEQHDALGKLGVNLLYGAYHLAGKIDALIKSLNDNLTAGEIEIDALRFEGPAFSAVDNRLVGLDLLRHGLAASVLYDPKGRIVPVYEETWGKPTLIYLKPRAGSAVPVDRLKERIAREGGVEADKVVSVEVVPLEEYREAGGFNEGKFLADATNPGYVLIVDKMGGEALREYARRLNTGFSAIALEGPQSPSDAVIPAAAGGRKAPLATYRYQP